MTSNKRKIKLIDRSFQFRELSVNFGEMTGVLSGDMGVLQKGFEELKQLHAQSAGAEEIRAKLSQLEAVAGKYKLS